MIQLSLDRDVIEVIFKANRATEEKNRPQPKPARESPKRISARLATRSMLDQRLRDIMTANSILIRADRMHPMLRHAAITKTVDYLNNHQEPTKVFPYEFVASSLATDLGLNDAGAMAQYVSDRLLEMGHTHLQAEARHDGANVYIVTR
ncbi:MAG: hypothetical protein L0H36_02190 [bacterium]|nr:hypothetical protein [bacterium]